MGTETARMTSLIQEHKRLGAHLVEFASWLMPVRYTDIMEEHRVVRNACGLFDVSHMGHFLVQGKDAFDFLQYVITNDLNKISNGQALYTLICNEQGGVIDDWIIYKRAQDCFWIIVNASNVDSDFEWVKQHQGAYNVQLINQTEQWGLLALQGPRASLVLEEIFKKIEFNYFFYKDFVYYDQKIWIARTGYTGEDGFELAVPRILLEKIWLEILTVGQKFGIKPIGLGARDSLRLEMKYLLYGNDMDLETSPIEAGLTWAVSFEKSKFIAKEVLLQQSQLGVSKKLVGFKMNEAGVPRHGYQVRVESQLQGVVTSGGFSPTLEQGIGLAYVPIRFAQIGQNIEIDIHHKLRKATIVKTPFVPGGLLKKTRRTS